MITTDKDDDVPEQFDRFRENVRKILGESLVGEIGPTHGQFGFATTEPDLGPARRAKSLDAIEAARAKYPQLARCPVAPFAVDGRTVYCMAGLDRAARRARAEKEA